MKNSARALNDKQTTPDSSVYLGGDLNAALRANRFVKWTCSEPHKKNSAWFFINLAFPLDRETKPISQDHHAMCYPAELTGSQNSCQLNIRRISIVCNNVYAISTILLLYYIYVFIFIYLYV